MTIHKRGQRAFYARHWAMIIGALAVMIVIAATGYFGLAH